MEGSRLIIHKVWRSEIILLVLFGVTGLAAIILSHYFPGSIISGDLIVVSGFALSLRLPLFWLIPAGFLFLGILRIYDVRYAIGTEGMQAQVGNLGLVQRTTNVRFSDVRSAETFQTLFERLLGVGDVEVGTAATGGVEVVFEGIASPHEVQAMIQRERDRLSEIT